MRFPATVFLTLFMLYYTRCGKPRQYFAPNVSALAEARLRADNQEHLFGKYHRLVN